MKTTTSTTTTRYEGRTKLKQTWSCDVGYERFLGPEIFFNPEIFSADFIQVFVCKSSFTSHYLHLCPFLTPFLFLVIRNPQPPFFLFLSSSSFTSPLPSHQSAPPRSGGPVDHQVPHRLPPPPLRKHRPVRGVHHVQRLWEAAPAGRGQARQGPHEGNTRVE